MTRKEKQLLLKVLCLMLPYRVIVQVKDWTTLDTELKTGHIRLFQEDYLELKPYLRSMSSMTEEEKINLYKVTGFYYLSNNELLNDKWYSFKNSIENNKLFFPYPIWLDDLQKVFDWLNTHHFDYQGLIEKGLAIEAPEGMYN